MEMIARSALWLHCVLPSSADLFVSALIYLLSRDHIFSPERHVKPSLDAYLCLLPGGCGGLLIFWSFIWLRKWISAQCFLTPSDIGCHSLALCLHSCSLIKGLVITFFFNFEWFISAVQKKKKKRKENADVKVMDAREWSFKMVIRDFQKCCKPLAILALCIHIKSGRRFLHQV